MEMKKKQHENDTLVDDEVAFIEEGESMISTIDDDCFDPDFVMSGMICNGNGEMHICHIDRRIRIKKQCVSHYGWMIK